MEIWRPLLTTFRNFFCIKKEEAAVNEAKGEEEDVVADSDQEAPISEAKGEEEEDGVPDSDKEDPISEAGGEIEEEKTGKSEKEPVTPVNERPTRERKKTERYVLDTPLRCPGTKTKHVSVEQGRGTQLKEIHNVAYKLSKRKPDDNLFLLHTILYGKKAKAQMLKKNIGQFSGFVWSAQEEEKQRAKAKDKLEKCIKENLIDFCDVLDIPINKSNVKKEELVVRLLEFLVHPKATREVVLADTEKETKKRKKSTPKNVTSGESSNVPAKRRRQANKSEMKQDQPSETEEGNYEGDDDSRGEDDATPEKENDKNDDTESKDAKDKTEEKKSTTKKEKPTSEEKKSLKISAKSSRKSSRQVDKSTSASSKKQKVEKDNSVKEKGKKQTSEPHAKESKDQGTEKGSKRGIKEPTNKELHVVVAKILKEVDFDTTTLSDILRKLGSHFGLDIMHRKTEVKDIITDAINEMSHDDKREENTENEGEKEKKDKDTKG